MLGGHSTKLNAWVLVILAGLMVAAPPPAPPVALAQETPKDIVATQVRRQGHPCTNPQEAQRDLAASKPDQPVWVLRCDNATYWVRMIPDMAAQIRRID